MGSSVGTDGRRREAGAILPDSANHRREDAAARQPEGWGEGVRSRVGRRAHRDHGGAEVPCGRDRGGTGQGSVQAERRQDPETAPGKERAYRQRGSAEAELQFRGPDHGLFAAGLHRQSSADARSAVEERRPGGGARFRIQELDAGQGGERRRRRRREKSHAVLVQETTD